MSLNFLQLSDIHFNKHDRDDWDPDTSIRDELLFDLKRLVEQGPGSFAGVLVTGDIAFSGQQREYDAASQYLRDVCDAIDCHEENVWVVPGNHDVDRSAARNSHPVRNLHRGIRDTVDAKLDQELEQVCRDEESGEHLFRPLSSYNEFARPFNCAVSCERLFWEEEFDFSLGYKLHVRGITTALVSDDLDDENEIRLAVGRVQCRIPRRKGVLNMTLGHHPPMWMRDRDELSRLLESHAHVQLWGHRHVYSPKVDAGRYVIHAGAMQPDRAEATWSPHYNALSLDVTADADGHHYLHAVLYPRRWFGDRFGQDRGPDGEYPILLGPVAIDERNLASMAAAPPSASVEVGDAPTAPAKPLSDTADRPLRRLGFRYARLPYQARLDIARQLGLVDPANTSPSDEELIDGACDRARRDNKIADLWDAVGRCRGDSSSPNPFR